MTENPTLACFVCPSCGATVPAGSRFCDSCGASLARTHTCPSCGAGLSPSARFCGSCGQAVNSTARAATPPTPPPPPPSYAPAPAPSDAPAPQRGQEPAPRRGRGCWLVGILVLAVIALLACCGGLYALSNSGLLDEYLKKTIEQLGYGGLASFIACV